MPKYEIMLIIDPKSNIEIVENLTKEVFGEDVTNIEKLDRTQLAYSIKNSTTGVYLVLNVNTKEQNIKEFTRKVNLQKSIWRNLIVNLDIEEGKRVKSQVAAKKKLERRSFRTFRKNIESKQHFVQNKERKNE